MAQEDPDFTVEREAAALRLLEPTAVPAPEPPGSRGSIHRDYHPGNTFWSRDRLTGVVDWTQASWGDPRADVGTCG
jgi:Ser/Thr protein kinase RdoA (MazF antagonist)